MRRIPLPPRVALAQVRDQADRLYSDNLQTTLLAQNAASDIDDGFELAYSFYAAKAGGRNRVELFTTESGNGAVPELAVLDRP